MVDNVLRTDEAAPRPENAAASQIAVLAGLAALGTLATNILLPSLPQMAEALRVTSATVTSAITVFLVVFALGQLVVGPISDSYGRRWPVFAGFAVFVAGSIWCASSSTLASLLIGRMIQAAGACSTSVLSRAIARDLFAGIEKLPIISPHGHTDPAWFSVNAPFEDAVSLLIWPDHYLLRLLYSQGVSLESMGLKPRDGAPFETDRRKIWRLFAERYYVFRGTPSRLWLDHTFCEVFALDRRLEEAAYVRDNLLHLR